MTPDRDLLVVLALVVLVLSVLPFIVRETKKGAPTTLHFDGDVTMAKRAKVVNFKDELIHPRRRESRPGEPLTTRRNTKQA